MSIQKEKSERTRQSLVKSALELFKQKGYENVGVREIAAAAGMTTGSFYHHFQGKINVLDEIYESRDTQFGEELRNLAGQNPGPETVFHFFLENITPIVENDGKNFTLHRMFEMRKHSTEAQELYVEMIALIRTVQEAGGFTRAFSAEQINEHLFLVFRGVMYEWCIAGEEVGKKNSLKELMQRHMGHAVNAFRKDYAPM